MAKRDKPFHNPFASLKPVVPAAKPARPKAQVPPEEPDESVIFREAVGEVMPVRGKGRVPPPPPKVDLTRVPNGDSEALAELYALVESDGPIELSDSDEYIEGAIPSFDRKTLRKLRAGERRKICSFGFSRSRVAPENGWFWWCTAEAFTPRTKYRC